MLLALVVAGLVLGRDDDRGRLGRLAVLEAQGDLALGVGLQERRRPEWRSFAISVRILWL